MSNANISVKVVNNISRDDRSYLANWDVFSQALFHPIVNAVKFNKQRGSISLKISMHDIDFRQAFLRCEVKDTGLGIAPAKMKYLFKAFKITDEKSQPSGG